MAHYTRLEHVLDYNPHKKSAHDDSLEGIGSLTENTLSS